LSSVDRRVNSLLRLIDAFSFEIAAVSTRLTAQLAREPGYQALLTLPGVGPVLAGVFFAEIGCWPRAGPPAGSGGQRASRRRPGLLHRLNSGPADQGGAHLGDRPAVHRGVRLAVPWGQPGPRDQMGSGREAVHVGLGGEPFLQGLVEAFDLAAGLRVVRAGVLLLNAEGRQFLLEPVPGGAAAAAAGEPGGVDQPVEFLMAVKSLGVLT
jgi:hypothetical protein